MECVALVERTIQDKVIKCVIICESAHSAITVRAHFIVAIDVKIFKIEHRGQ